MAPPSRTQLLSCFIGSNIVALGSGTPYLYSFYAPQLLQKCQLPISKSSTLSFSMTIGSSAMGFLAGLIIDKKSPAYSSVLGALGTFVAYGTLRYCYVNEVGSVLMISAALILVGFGSVSGFYGAVKCCTTNFPHHRGTAGAFPVALYALAGLLYSSLCAWLFGDRMDLVFTFLMCVCSSMILVGGFTLKILVGHSEVKKRRKSSTIAQPVLRSSGEAVAPSSQPIAIQGRSNARDSRGSFSNYKSFMRRSMSQISSSTDSLVSLGSSMKRTDSYVWSKELAGSLSFWGWGKARPSDSSLNKSVSESPSPVHKRDNSAHSNSTEAAPLSSSIADNTRRDSLLRESNPLTIGETPENYELEPILSKPIPAWQDNHIYQTVTQPRFLAFFLILSILSGIGQTYIYSVGFVVDTMVHSDPDIKVNTEAIQSLQVSIISIMSFLGRLSAGPISDLLVKKVKAQRAWCVLVACALMFVASRQILSDVVSIRPLISSVNAKKRYPAIDNISLTSFTFGYAFGVTFGTFPAIIADQFGTAGFSTTWGLCTTGGMISVKAFSAVFANDLSSNTKVGKSFCIKGSLCYRHTFHITALFSIINASIVCLLIAVSYWQKKLKRTERTGNAVFVLDEDESTVQHGQHDFAAIDENEV